MNFLLLSREEECGAATTVDVTAAQHAPNWTTTTRKGPRTKTDNLDLPAMDSPCVLCVVLIP